LFIRDPECFGPTNYKNPRILFPLEVVLIVQGKGKGKGKAISVQTRRDTECSKL